jgi:phytoene synthase
VDARAALLLAADALRAADRDRWLVTLWTPARTRDSLTALFALEAELWGLPTRLRDPMAAELRLAWWREALERLDDVSPPPQPLLAAAAAALLPVPGGAALAALEDAPLLALRGEVAEAARTRGRTVFALAARVLGAGERECSALGTIWAVGEASRLLEPGAGSEAPHPLRMPPVNAPRSLVALARLGARDRDRQLHARPPERRGSLTRQAIIARTMLIG